MANLWGIVRAWWHCRSSLAFLAEIAALRAPQAVALVDDQGPLTYAQMLTQVHGLAATLRAQNLQAGHRVALSGSNGREFVIGLLACLRLGARVLPLDPAAPPLRRQQILQRQRIDRHLDADALPLPLESPLLPLPCLKSPGELVVLTSGSTGIARGVRRRPGFWQLLPLTLGLLSRLPLRRSRPMALAIPLFHGYGLACLALSFWLLAPLQLSRRLEISPLLQRSPGALLITVPTLLRRWLQKHPLEPVAAILTGSAPLAPELCLEVLRRCGPCLYNLYGSSEAGVMALASPRDLQAAPGCVGFPLPGNQIRLDSSPGPILVRGPLVVGGDAQGWYATGDLGRWDSSGRLFVCGRTDSMFISGGDNVYPFEIEEVLLLHPAVAEAHVLVVSDDDLGQRAQAFVRRREGQTLEDSELKAWVEAHLERSKRPRSYHFVDSFPLNPLGKLDRLRLLEGDHFVV